MKGFNAWDSPQTPSTENVLPTPKPKPPPPNGFWLISGKQGPLSTFWGNHRPFSSPDPPPTDHSAFSARLGGTEPRHFGRISSRTLS